MTTKHTPGPWRIDDVGVGFEIAAGNEVVAQVQQVYGDHTHKIRRGNARRIVACVNACEGISAENLEENKPIIELARAYNVSLRQRDDLLAALRSAVNDADGWGLADDECGWLPIARAAIARATGEQP